MPPRNAALDGLRGALAGIVLVYHCFMDQAWLYHLSNVAVFGFFVLSGMVLTRGWDGRWLAFLGRRFVRLWPVYAVTLAGALLVSGHDMAWSRFFWWPPIGRAEMPQINPPAWSLCIEAFAMLAMPLFATCRRGVVALAVALGCLLGALAVAPLFFGMFFALGAWLSRFEPRTAVLETAPLQWLGRISYPLYLSHWPVIMHLPGPLWLKLAAALAVAQLLAVTIERWSIAASRRIGRARRP